MPDLVFKIIYFAGILVEMVIRAPLDRQRRKAKVASNQVNRQERLILGLLFLGMFGLPALYTFTPWLDFANYELPDWAGWLGAVLLAGAVLVFYQAHRDLGRNWSPSLQVFEGHTLVTHGIYHYIRHPMYASQWLWIMAQMLLLQNWLAGVAGALTFLPLYLLRVPGEEQMMLEQFGEQYRAYMRRTGRVVPRLGRPG
jgi:protein-S-isoprenylcysteine O-methyltransferase Ste14